MFLDRSFCMEAGQFKSGSNVDDTYQKMLQQVHRVTPPVADAITGTYKTVHALIRAFQRSGPDVLENLQVYSQLCRVLIIAEINRRGNRFPKEDRSCAFKTGI
jgi:hypothetical protein